ncbi:putative siderophore biosynthesis protein SbnA [Corynebacterium occultum]|uniref:Putative siderophore biosynthesis protein SbnA n=2 Tax=Corynebacterium occultum TaxID=2675219 RepID=A0A6B8W533_9CORY|nr:putative siderophore biosynthesis protein SbnA [Corynebacterium occultum]
MDKVGRMYAPNISSPMGIRSTVGDTPLVRLDRLTSREDITVWAKLEEFNPGSSTKDRTAAALVDQGISSGLLTEGVSIVESSSGNLGIALSRECLLHGWPFHCVVDPRANARTVAIMKAFGAVVHMVEEPDPLTGDWLAARRNKVQELLKEIPCAVTLDQYSNRAAFEAHSEGTMREILDTLGHAPDLLFVAMSTTGTIGGCIKRLKEEKAATRALGVDAEGSVLFGGSRGTRNLPGFGAGVSPDLERDVAPDEIIRVADVDSVVGARALVHREGILAGASAGAVTAALLQRIHELPSGTEVVLILHDSGAAYVETIYDDEWVHSTLNIDAAELARREAALR